MGQISGEVYCVVHSENFLKINEIRTLENRKAKDLLKKIWHQEIHQTKENLS